MDASEKFFYFYSFRFPWQHAQNTCLHSDAPTRVRTVCLAADCRCNHDETNGERTERDGERKSIGKKLEMFQRKKNIRCDQNPLTVHGHGFFTRTVLTTGRLYYSVTAIRHWRPSVRVGTRFVRLKTRTDGTRPSLYVGRTTTFGVGVRVFIYSLRRCGHIHFVSISNSNNILI